MRIMVAVEALCGGRGLVLHVVETKEYNYGDESKELGGERISLHCGKSKDHEH
jgi:hypothetical protein